MPRRPAYDGGHTPFTDHRILAKPSGEASRLRPLPLKLRAWREPRKAFAQRNLGLAHIAVGESHQSPANMNEGFRLLSSVQNRFAADPAVLTSLGAVLQRRGASSEAAKLFLRAATLEPRDARHRLNIAVAAADSGNREEAISRLEEAISLDPYLRDAYLLLAELCELSGEKQKHARTLERYLDFEPRSIAVRRLLRR